METNSENSVILEKTRELCQAIIEQLDFQTIRQRVDAFLADESIKLQYQELSDRGAMLQHKQQTGMPLDMAEIAEFEKRREAFLSSPVAQGFLHAHQAMQQVQVSVDHYLTNSLELDRM